MSNLIEAIKKRTKIQICPKEKVIDPLNDALFQTSFIYMTGHGRFRWNAEEVKRLRMYFKRGGFLWVDDNYGLDPFFQKEIIKIFPGRQLKEVPFSHPIFKSFYSFPKGLPKIHEHDGGPPKGYGLFVDGKMVVFYSKNTDIGDGMEDLHVHKVGPKKHEEALKMGVNVMVWFLNKAR